jgi:hypothetical protein
MVIHTAPRATTTTVRNPSKCTSFAAPPRTRTGLRTISLRMTKDLVTRTTLLAFPHLVVLRPVRIVIARPSSASVMMRHQPLTSRLLPDYDLHRVSALIFKTAMAATVVVLTMPTTIGARREAAIVVVLAPEWHQTENSSEAIVLLHLN